MLRGEVEFAARGNLSIFLTQQKKENKKVEKTFKRFFLF